MRLYVLLTIIFAVITTISVIVVSAPATQNPPLGPIEIGLGPSPEAALNKTELFIDIPDETINVQVTFRFNQTAEKYFIYTLLPYNIEQASPYAIYDSAQYPFKFPNDVNANFRNIGNFSTNYMNTANGSSIVNATLELNSTFPFSFLFEPDQKDELTLGVSIRVNESLIAISDRFGASQTSIFTFFGDVSGIWSDKMLAYMLPSSQPTLTEPFIVQLRLPPSSYFQTSQPTPIEYYVKQDQRWLMFSMDFLNGQYAQTLVCNYVDPAGQYHAEIAIFLIGVFSALTISFLIEALKTYYTGKEKRERPPVSSEALSSETSPPPPDIEKLRKLVDNNFEKRLRYTYPANALVLSYYILYGAVIGVIAYLLFFVTLVVPKMPIEIAVPSIVGLIAALISFIALVTNVPKLLGPQELLGLIVTHNFKKMEKSVNESEKPFLKALIKMKSMNPEFKLQDIDSKTMFNDERLLKRLYE
jgi:hypothetical protein